MITTTTPTGNTVVRDSLGLGQGGIRLAQQEVPLRINSGTNTGPGFCFLDGSSVPMTDAQLATLYPTVQSYVDKVVATTLANAAAGYIPRDFTRDPAWYTDIRDAVNDYAARIDSGVAGQLRALRRARRGARRRRATSTRAILDLDLLADLATQQHRRRRRARRRAAPDQGRDRAAVEGDRRPDVHDDDRGRVGGIVPATLSLTLGAPATFGAFTPGVARDYTASTHGDRDLDRRRRDADVADPSATATGHLVNGAFALPQALQVAGTGAFAPLGGSASPTPLKTWIGADLQRGGHGQVQAVDRRQRRAPDRHLQQDADVHALDHDAVETPAAVPPARGGTAASASLMPDGSGPCIPRRTSGPPTRSRSCTCCAIAAR